MGIMPRRNGLRSKAGLSAAVLGLIGLTILASCSGTDAAPEHTRTVGTREGTADGGVVAPRELFLSAYDQCKQALTKNTSIGWLTLPAGATEDDPLYVSLIANVSQVAHVNFGSIAHVSSPTTTLGADIAQVPDLTPQGARTLFGPLFDLCVAEKLRAVAPGMMGAEATLYSDSEQRELLYYTFNRAQRAAVGFARLGEVLLSDNPTQSTDPDPDGYLPLINWARANPSALVPLGEAFASAVNLHTTVSVEMAEMLARSASARYPRGAAAKDPIDELFGAGSWRMRATALVYGGASLADEGAPWTEVEGIDQPGFGGWPSRLDAPRPLYSVPEPEAHLFGKLVSASRVVVDPTTKATAPGAIPLYTKPGVDLVTGCEDLDAERTGGAVYDALECLTAWNTATCNGHSLSTDPADYQLWQRYRLTREHAVAWARHLADRMGVVCMTVDPDDPGIQKASEGTLIPVARGPAVVRGTMLASPAAEARLTGRDSLAPTTYLGASSSFQDNPLEKRVAAFARLRPWEKPTGAFPSHFENGHIGHEGYGNIAHMGAASAMVAIREMLHDTTRRASWGDSASVAVFEALTAKAQDVHTLIDAHVGMASVDVSRAWYEWSQNVPHIVVSVRVDATDSWWTNTGSTYSVCAKSGLPAGELAVAQDSKLGSKTLAGLMATCDTSIPLTRETVIPVANGVKKYEEKGVVRYSGGVDAWLLPATLIAVRDDGNGRKSYRLMSTGLDTGTGETFISTGGRLGQLVERLWETQKANPAKPKYDGFGYRSDFVPPADATLVGGTSGQSALQVYLTSAKEAANNATSAVQSAMDALLQQQVDVAAAGAADTRAAEVTKLEEQGLCGAAAQTGVASTEGTLTCREAVALQLEPVLNIDVIDASPTFKWSKGFGKGADVPTDCMAQALANNPISGVESVAPSLEGWDAAQQSLNKGVMEAADLSAYVGTGVALIRSFGDGLGGGELGPKVTAEDKAAAIYLYCKALHNVNIVAGKYLPAGSTGGRAQVARIVAMRRRESVVPSFSEFSGGELQSALIEQWTALRKLEEEADSYLVSADAVVFKVLAAKAAANAAIQEYKDSCNPGRFAMATAACFHPYALMPGVEFDAQPLLDYQNNCTRLANQAGPVVAAADSALADANAQVTAGAMRFTDASATVHLSSAQIAQLVQKTEAAARRNDLERDLSKTTLATQFGLYGRYHSYDMWRAKAMVESARRQAVIARRAIEIRFVVDLSAMQSDEPFVAAPARWSDEVYAYDMSLPAAVGLTTGLATGGGIYVNKLTDYVDNLERFVQGFVVARPTAASKEDSEILSIRGPYDTTSKTDAFGTHLSPSAQAGKWEVFCSSTGKWSKVYTRNVQMNSFLAPDQSSEVEPKPLVVVKEAAYGWPENPCGSAGSARPTRARVVFSLDPWGRLDSTDIEEPYFRRYNARWTRLTVNLVGSGIQECDAATDPSQCYTSPFVSYNLSHVGPAWVTNYEQQWRELSIPVGQVEAGKALAAEYWLDALTGWSKPMVEAAARAEFTDRPVGGEYLLELQLGPEINLRGLERVQVLAGMTCWVKQD